MRAQWGAGFRHASVGTGWTSSTRNVEGDGSWRPRNGGRYGAAGFGFVEPKKRVCSSDRATRASWHLVQIPPIMRVVSVSPCQGSSALCLPTYHLTLSVPLAPFSTPEDSFRIRTSGRFSLHPEVPHKSDKSTSYFIASSGSKARQPLCSFPGQFCRLEAGVAPVDVQ